MASTRRPDNGPRRTPPPLLASTGFLFALIGTEARRRFTEQLVPLGLKPPHHGVLAYLAAYGPAAQVELGHGLGFDASDVVTYVDVLERRGFVRRDRDPVDRRRYAVSLTPDGRAAYERTMALSLGVVDPLFADLTPGDRATLRDLLLRIAARIDQPVPTDD